MKRISVVIPLYNRAGLITATLRSVERQRRRPDEVIVVDDHSTDASAETVRRFAGASPLTVRLCFNRRRKGVSGATNCGIAAAAGEYVALLDSDDLWAPNHLSQLERGLELFPEAGIAFSRVRVFGDALDAAAKEREFTAATAGCLGAAFLRKGGDRWLSGERLLFALLDGGVPFRCQAALLRKELIMRRGLLFNENITFTQDAQFLTIAAYYTAFLYVDVPGLLLRRHPENDGDTVYARKTEDSYDHRVREMKTFFRKARLTPEERGALRKRLIALHGSLLRLRGGPGNGWRTAAEAMRLLAAVPSARSVKAVLKVILQENQLWQK
jgi:glycosyltransferase involved in cell wall biosynthesis